MSLPTLTTAQANWLYQHGLAFVEGTYGLVTRTADYQWDHNEQRYIRETEGLQVEHRIGARWAGTRFVRCDCDHCRKYPEITSSVDLF